MSILSNTLSIMLRNLFNITGDWGIAIILLTILVRFIFLPLSMKQKLNMVKQQNLSKKISEIKEKYKNDAEKLEKEMKKYYEESAKSMMGCFVSLLQLPVISSLYFTITRMPIEVGTMIIPWVSILKLPDRYFIVPLIYVVASLSPNLLYYIKLFQIVNQPKASKSTIIINSIFSLLITVKAPVAIGIYFITTSLFSLIEEIIFRIYVKNRGLLISKQ